MIITNQKYKHHLGRILNEKCDPDNYLKRIDPGALNLLKIHRDEKMLKIHRDERIKVKEALNNSKGSFK